MNLWKSWKFFGELSPILGENVLGQHKVLFLTWYAKVPHDRRDICCGSVTWETTSVAPNSHHLTHCSSSSSRSAADSHSFCLTCPRMSFKRSKNGSKIIHIFFVLPFSDQLSLSCHIPLGSFLVGFPISAANVPVTVVPMLVCRQLDWMHQAFLKSFRSTHHWLVKNSNYHRLCIWECVIN